MNERAKKKWNACQVTASFRLSPNRLHRSSPVDVKESYAYSMRLLKYGEIAVMCSIELNLKTSGPTVLPEPCGIARVLFLSYLTRPPGSLSKLTTWSPPPMLAFRSLAEQRLVTLRISRKGAL